MVLQRAPSTDSAAKSVSSDAATSQRTPLDSSQRPRLINLRLRLAEREPQSYPGIFLTEMRSRVGPMARVRSASIKALQRWFCCGHDLYDLQISVNGNSMLAQRHLDVISRSGLDLMDEAERRWADSSSKTFSIENGDSFWATETAESSEARVTSSRKAVAAARRMK